MWAAAGVPRATHLQRGEPGGQRRPDLQGGQQARGMSLGEGRHARGNVQVRGGKLAKFVLSLRDLNCHHVLLPRGLNEQPHDSLRMELKISRVVNIYHVLVSRGSGSQNCNWFKLLKQTNP